MAYLFELWAYVGEDHEAAEQIGNHFRGQTWLLPSGRPSVFGSTFTVAVYEVDGSGWAVLVVPDGDRQRIASIQPDVASAVGFQLYELLRKTSGYAWALVGVEVEDALLPEELPSEFEGRYRFPGVVFSEDIWRQFGAPGEFVPFSSGYVWMPYRGEPKPDIPPEIAAEAKPRQQEYISSLDDESRQWHLALLARLAEDDKP